jgi:hypothetical protein
MTDLRAIAEAATPGPWVALNTGSEGSSVVPESRGPRIARLTNGPLEACQADARFIAAARNTYLAALDVIEAAKRDYHRPMTDDPSRCATCLMSWPCRTGAALDHWTALTGDKP